MKTGIKSLQLTDYDEIKSEVEQLYWILDELRAHVPGIRIDAPDVLPNKHKMWEWGRALHAIKEVAGVRNVLDIGASYGLLGPALCYLGYNVVEVEPDSTAGQERVKLNMFLDTFNRHPIHWINASFGELKQRCNLLTDPNGQYGVVMSISTIEHLPPDVEKLAWKEMADMVKPGGLFIATVDLVPEAARLFYAQNEAINYFDMNLIKDKVDELKSYGFSAVGGEDYLWHGAHVEWPGAPVAHFSFGSVIMKRNQK